MKFQIKFTSGERNGETFPLTPEQVVSIGRSHSNTIRISTLDVSGRHISLRIGRGGNVSAEVLSSRITKHNGKDVNIGDMLEISEGDTIQMGDESAFVIEKFNDDDMKTGTSDEEKTTPPAPSPSDDENSRTVPQQQSDIPQELMDKTVPAVADEDDDSAGDGDKTIAVKTRVASDDELENIKKAYRVKHRKKIFLIAFPVILFFALAVFLYFYLKPEAEEFVSWPTDKQGEFLNDFKQVAPYLAVVYPKVPGNTVKTDDNVTEINTRIGKQLDVRLHILISNFKDPATLQLDHPDAFDSWMEKMRDKEPTLNFGGDRTLIFLNQTRGSGVPLSCISYTRRVGNDDFWGYALFIRNADNIHTFMIEVPAGERWRSEPFIRSQATIMAIYAVRRTEEHWEGTSSYRKNTDVATDLREAANFMKRKAPVYWGRIFYLIRSALIKSTITGDKGHVSEAQKMLLKLRNQQTDWYNTQKLAYQYAVRNEDKLTMNSIQATAESVFSSEFQYSDARYEKIKRKDWQ